MDIKEAVHRLRLLAERETNYKKGQLIHFDECRRRPTSDVRSATALANIVFEAALYDARARILLEAADMIEQEASTP